MGMVDHRPDPARQAPLASPDDQAGSLDAGDAEAPAWDQEDPDQVQEQVRLQ